MYKISYKSFIKWCLSPTLYISDCYKKGALTPNERGRRVKQLNVAYFVISCMMFLGIVMIDLIPKLEVIRPFILVIYPVWTISRANEVFMAFIQDVFDKLNPRKRKKNGLEYYERIALAFRSFLELVIQYAMLYFLFDTYFNKYGLQYGLFNKSLQDPLTALYYSLITIVSIGYGDYYPIHPLGKLIVMHEIINGLLLLAVSFTVYVGLDLDEKEAS